MQTFIFTYILLSQESEAFTFPKGACKPLTEPFGGGIHVFCSWSVSQGVSHSQPFTHDTPIGQDTRICKHSWELLYLSILWNCFPLSGQKSAIRPVTTSPSFPPVRPHWKIPRTREVKVPALKGSHPSGRERQYSHGLGSFPSSSSKQYKETIWELSQGYVPLIAKPVGDLEKPFRESTITSKERMKTIEQSNLDNYFVYSASCMEWERRCGWQFGFSISCIRSFNSKLESKREKIMHRGNENQNSEAGPFVNRVFVNSNFRVTERDGHQVLNSYWM